MKDGYHMDPAVSEGFDRIKSIKCIYYFNINVKLNYSNTHQINNPHSWESLSSNHLINVSVEIGI